MSDAPKTVSNGRRRWFQFRLRTLLVAFTAIALVLGLAIHYRVHLLWHLTAWRLDLNDVQPLPVTPMPETEVPDDWVICRFGSLQFSLPPALARNMEGAPSGLAIFSEVPPHAMIVSLPADTADALDFVQTDLAMPPEGQELSTVMLRLACFRTGTDEFRWSMAPGEVRWFIWRVMIGRFGRFGSEQRAETLIRDDLEGVAYFRAGHVEFDWQSKGVQAGGIITLIDSSKGEVDLAWIRAVCGSVKCTGKSLPSRTSKEEVEAQFEILTE